MQSPLLDFLPSVFVGQSPGFDVFVLFSQSEIQLLFDSCHHLRRIVLLFKVEVLYKVRNRFYPLLAPCFDLLIVLLLFEQSVDEYSDAVAIFFPLLLGKSTCPVEFELGYDDIVEVVVIVVVFEQFFVIFEGPHLNFIIELFGQ